MNTRDPKFMIFIRIGRDNFKRDGFTPEYTKDLFDSHTEDKATEVKVLKYDTSECVAHSRRGQTIINNL